MLAVPLLVGVAAGRFVPAHLLLAAVAVAGYLLAATLQAAARARDPRVFVTPLAVYTAVLAATVVPLLAIEPRLVLAAVVVVPASAASLAMARARRSRGLSDSLAQAAEALVLAPAAAILGSAAATSTASATLVAALYLGSTVLVVRSAIRERSSTRFAVASVAYHVVAIGIAAVALPAAYVGVALLLTVRAVAVPYWVRRLARLGRPLRPVRLGMLELVTAVVVVLVAFAVPL